MRHRNVRKLGAALALMLASLAAPARAAEPLPVIASFSILADLARQVGGERVAVASLVGPDADAHVFEPAPADAARVAAARVVVMNGLGMEGWMERLVSASGGKATLVTASKGVQPMREGGELDPHAFGSPANVKLYVTNIRDALVAADPEGRAAYEANATAYLGKLDALDADVRRDLAAIPANRRRLITTHDAFGYFAKAYGLQFLAPSGVSTESEIAARDIAKVVRQVKQEKIPAVFLENVTNPRLMERIAHDGGARIGGKLYSDALSGPDGPAATYLDLVRSNVRTLVAALKP